MKTQEHTAGPWQVLANGDSIYHFDGDKCSFVCCVSHNSRERSNPERNANARLIAAAPQLLEALEEAVRTYETDNPLNVEQIEAAIRSAKGETL